MNVGPQMALLLLLLINYMSTVTRIFQVPSDVSKDSEVFDHLVEVKDCETGEVGTLLCSHYCKWPEDLVSQATWLEGCYTPNTHKDDTRLALGYHPRSITQWSWSVDRSKIEITADTSNVQPFGEGEYIEGELILDGPISINHPEPQALSCYRTLKAMYLRTRRTCPEVSTQDIIQGILTRNKNEDYAPYITSCLQEYCNIPLESWEAGPDHQEDQYLEVGTFRFTNDGGALSFRVLRRLVIHSNIIEGYVVATKLPYLVVNSETLFQGRLEIERFTIPGLYVVENNEELGFHIAADVSF